MSSFILDKIDAGDWPTLDPDELCRAENRRIFYGADADEQEGLFLQLPGGAIEPYPPRRWGQVRSTVAGPVALTTGNYVVPVTSNNTVGPVSGGVVPIMGGFGLTVGPTAEDYYRVTAQVNGRLSDTELFRVGLFFGNTLADEQTFVTPLATFSVALESVILIPAETSVSIRIMSVDADGSITQARYNLVLNRA